MILRRVFRKHLPEGKDGDVSFVVILLGIVLVAAAIVKLVQFFTPPPSTPVLTQKDGLVRVNSMEEIADHTSTLAILPEERFDSEFYLAGIYTQGEENVLIEGTVALVLDRNGSRFVQISFQPGLTLEQQMERYLLLTKEEVMIGDNVGYLITLENSFIECSENPDDIPDVCTFSKALTFSAGETVVTITVDGEHASDGEVIAMGRSIVGQVVSF